MKKTTTKILLLALTLISFNTYSNDESVNHFPEMQIVSLEDQKRELRKIDVSVANKWRGLIRNQKNDEWMETQGSMKLAGPVFSKGWLGTQVSRTIVPDREGGWLAIDTVTMGQDLILKAAVLAGNILLSQYFPYIQGGIIKDKKIVNIRPVEKYKQALALKPFHLKDLPLSTEGVEKMNEGDIFNTILTGGFYVRAGGGIANMIGLELPAHINIGPKSKLTVRKSLKVSISKSGDQEVLVSLEGLREKEFGIGIGFGVFFDDIIDLPVSIGVNAPGGLYPLLINHKEKKTDMKAVVYRIDLKTEEGREAYKKFLQRDLTGLEDLVDHENDTVVREMVREGVIYTTETNFAINLIFWRTGHRNIYTDGFFTTTVRNGNRFHYEEVTQELLDSSSWFGSVEDQEERFSVLIPLAVEIEGDEKSNMQPFDENMLGSFVMDTTFLYQDNGADGDEIEGLQELMLRKGSLLRLPLRVDDDKDYGTLLLITKVRFSATGIRKILSSSERDRWLALGAAFGLPDPHKWLDWRVRRREWEDSENNRKEWEMRRAKTIIRWMKKIDKMDNVAEKAKYMIKKLADGKTGDYFHHVLMELAGSDQLIIRGYIKGQNF